MNINEKNINEKLTILCKFFTLYDYTEQENNIYLIYNIPDINHIKEELEKIIQKEALDIGSDNISIDLNKCFEKMKIFVDIKEFLHSFSIETYEQDFAIIKINDNKFLYSIKKNAYEYDINTKETNKSNIINNAYNYLKLINILKSNEISDYHNYNNKEFILYSSNGMFKIQYPTNNLNEEIINTKKNIELVVNTFNNNIKSQDYITILKNEIREHLKLHDPKNNIFILINEFESIYNATQSNWNLYMNRFIFKDKLLEEKNKYYKSIDAILGNCITQIITISIAFYGSIFVLRDDNFSKYSLFIIIIFHLYSLLIFNYEIYNLLHVKSIIEYFNNQIKKLSNTEDKENKNEINRKGIINITIIIISIISIVISNIFLISIHYGITPKNIICNNKGIIHIIIMIIVCILFFFFIFSNKKEKK